MPGESSSPKSVESHQWPRVNGPSSVNDSKGWYNYLSWQSVITRPFQLSTSLEDELWPLEIQDNKINGRGGSCLVNLFGGAFQFSWSFDQMNTVLDTSCRELEFQVMGNYVGLDLQFAANGSGYSTLESEAPAF
jgi:hypothetical protein